jgi:hypothetical protein
MDKITYIYIHIQNYSHSSSTPRCLRPGVPKHWRGALTRCRTRGAVTRVSQGLSSDTAPGPRAPPSVSRRDQGDFSNAHAFGFNDAKLWSNRTNVPGNSRVCKWQSFSRSAGRNGGCEREQDSGPRDHLHLLLARTPDDYARIIAGATRGQPARDLGIGPEGVEVADEAVKPRIVVLPPHVSQEYCPY